MPTQTTFTNLRRFRVGERLFVVNTQAVAFYDVSEADTDAICAAVSDVNAASGAARPDIPQQVQALLHDLDQQGVTECYERLQRSIELRQQDNGVRIFSLSPTHGCNLGCSYCYADEHYLERPAGGNGQSTEGTTLPIYGSPQGAPAKPSSLSMETADDFIQFALKETQPGEAFEVAFFGGEPMLQFDIMQHVVTTLNRLAPQQDRRVTYGLTTNGTILTDKHVDFLVENRFATMFSFDGLSSLQNKNRPFYGSNKGSYEHVVNNIRRALNHGLDIMVRATAPPAECDFTAIARAMLDLGITSFVIEPTTLSANQCDREVFQKLINSARQWSQEYVRLLGQQRFTYLGFAQNLSQIHRRSPRARACGAGVELVSVAPDGQLWPCMFWVGDQFEHWKLGDVKSGFKPNARSALRQLSVFDREGGEDCWARLFCGGCCYAAGNAPAHAHPGRSHFPAGPKMDCLYRQEMLKISAWIYSELAENDPDALQWVVTNTPMLG